ILSVVMGKNYTLTKAGPILDSKWTNMNGLDCLFMSFHHTKLIISFNGILTDSRAIHALDNDASIRGALADTIASRNLPDQSWSAQVSDLGQADGLRAGSALPRCAAFHACQRSPVGGKQSK